MLTQFWLESGLAACTFLSNRLLAAEALAKLAEYYAANQAAGSCTLENAAACRELQEKMALLCVQDPMINLLSLIFQYAWYNQNCLNSCSRSLYFTRVDGDIYSQVHWQCPGYGGYNGVRRAMASSLMSIIPSFLL